MNDLRYESNEESLVNNYELIRKKGNLREPRLQLQGRKEPTGCNLGSYGSLRVECGPHTVAARPLLQPDAICVLSLLEKHPPTTPWAFLSSRASFLLPAPGALLPSASPFKRGGS